MGKRVETEKRFGSEVPGVELDSSSMGSLQLARSDPIGSAESCVFPVSF
jgi:hypothetical protein